MILDIEQKVLDADIVVLAMNGRITMGSASQKIEWTIAELLKANHKRIIFDLSQVCYLDSSGVGILMMCHAKVKKADGKLVLVGANGMVAEALAMTSVNKIVPNYPTTKEAADDFRLA
jgi:anti-sigma B factor antagonist